MIKQYILTLEAPDENLINTFVKTLNKQAEAIKDVSPLKIHIEDKYASR
jgi:hypothetical protein